jgi:hypothetical protein
MRLHKPGSEGTASKEHEDLQRKRVQDLARTLPSRDAIAQFDALLWEQSREHGKEQLAENASDAVAARRMKKTSELEMDTLPTEIPLALMQQLQAQAPAHASAVAQQSAAQSQRAHDVAELLRKHVRQMAVSPKLAAQSTTQVWLRLSDELLPGTELLVDYQHGSWRVQARSDSDASIAMMESCSEQLRERFAASELGDVRLEIQRVR